MTSQATTSVLVRDASEGPAVWAVGSLFQQLASKAETGGPFGLTLVTQRHGSASPMHVHTREAEAFYLLDGNLTYQAGDETYQLAPESFIYLPPGVRHAFRVTSSMAKFLVINAPGGLIDIYDEVGRPAEERQLPEPDERQMQADVERWLAAAPRYGIEVVGPPLPG
jgi:quercetin dioxygenase-like cupin family protein